MDKQSLGDWAISKEFFESEGHFKGFRLKGFATLAQQQKSDLISKALLDLVQKAKTEKFLLIPVMDFIDKVNEEKIVDQYAFSHFELWLNQFSGLSFEQNYQVRGKIAGRFVPRDEYQVLFPLGMGKIYPGSHFVTAHSSPDLDTTVASFWGWVDAFAARVAENLHLWNVPEGAPASQVEISFLFYKIFGKNIFSHLAKNRTSLTICSLDLISQRGVIKKLTEESTLGIDDRQNAILLVDGQGFYLGEWRNIDVERVRFIITLLNQCLRWYENNLHVNLISLFAKESLVKDDLNNFSQAVFGMKIEECEPAQEFTEKQKELVEDYLCKVLGVSQGFASTFKEFAKAMKALSLFDFQEFVDLMESLQQSPLFDKSGSLKENRPQIFNYLAKIIQGLDKAIYSIRLFVERLDVALKVKASVLGVTPQHISHRADLEEIRAKMDGFSYLTVTVADEDSRFFPLGVVHATDLYKTTLGTVSLRDFGNREETKIPPYLEIISVIDHHKSNFATAAPSVIFINDAQSANSLVAQMSFLINDNYSTGGKVVQELEEEIKEIQKNLNSLSSKRILQRLLQKLLAAKKKGAFFVAKEREMIEYHHFLYAILDDTDLLTKVSARDIECVASLLNRLKSLMLGKEVEVIHFDDLSRDENFIKMATRRVLQNEDMYSLYCKIYLSKEEAVVENLKLCVQGKSSTIFADTKEQNGCCRVGQTKMFAKNFPFYQKHAKELCSLWVEEAKNMYKEKKEIDLHLHMISTIAGADELYAGVEGVYEHKDEIWIWIPMTEPAIEHLKIFLNTFRSTSHVKDNEMEVEFTGDNSEELKQIFTESFSPIPHKSSKKGLPIALFRFRAGTLNSRKAMISPYLPHA